jgi:DNA-binding SARP family transcriptional activator
MLKLYLLGPPRLEVEGAPLDLGLRKAIALVAYLAVTGDNHSRDAIATLLWPGYSQSKALAALRSVLWSLNKTLIERWLVVGSETINLSPGSDLWLDVTHFRRLLAESSQHRHPSGDICSDCLSRLTEAVSLYRDDFLAGFTLRDSPNFDEWQFFQTETLRRELAAALERLVNLHTLRQSFEAAIPHARRQLNLDPLHEPAHRQLMLLYARTGQQSAALRQYHQCANLLDAELGIPPSAETTALYERIRAGI